MTLMGGAAASETLIGGYICTIGGCSTPQKQPRENTGRGRIAGLRRGRIAGLRRGRIAGLRRGHITGLRRRRIAGLRRGRIAGLRRGHIAGLKSGCPEYDTQFSGTSMEVGKNPADYCKSNRMERVAMAAQSTNPPRS